MGNKLAKNHTGYHANPAGAASRFADSNLRRNLRPRRTKLLNRMMGSTVPIIPVRYALPNEPLLQRPQQRVGECGGFVRLLQKIGETLAG